jgi:hypothetical protein
MTRIPGHVLSIALGACLASACDVGSLPGIEPDGGGQQQGGPDAVAFLTCQQAGTPPAGGPAGELDHNVGQACMQAACHGPGGDGPNFTVGGTLYTDAAGNAPNAGGVVSIRDAAGTVIHMISAANGNFHTGQAVVLPVTTFSSKCPAIRPMIAQSATGDCNSAGCHAAGSATGRVWLDPP